MTIKTLQAALRAYGFAPGPLDGVWGERTCHALISFAAGRVQTPGLLTDARALAETMPAYGIDPAQPLLVAHFLAQIVHETSGLTILSESTTYRDADRLDALFTQIHGVEDARALIRNGPVAIGNRIYAGRNGNGTEASGDGYRYRGRGYLQHTGRRNYQLMAIATGLDLVGDPDMLLTAIPAALAACAFWRDNNVGTFAARDDSIGVRRAVNGPALLGLVDCVRIADRVKHLYGATP